MIEVVLLVVLGCLYGNFMEWFLHKYILHGLGQKPKSKFSFHWLQHHRLVRIKKYRDPSYDRDSLFAWNPRTQEIAWLGVVAALHAPVFWLAPVFGVTTLLWTVFYYLVHFISHKRPAIGKKYFRHHYEHHMGEDQEKNFCVTFPLMDYVFGTRQKYPDLK